MTGRKNRIVAIHKLKEIRMFQGKALLSLVMVFLSLICLAPAHSQDIEFTEGFKNAKWGMNRKQVKNISPNMQFTDEGFSEGIEYMLAMGTIGDQAALIKFDFVNEKLFRVSNTFKVKPEEGSMYLAVFNRLDTALGEKYGKPVKKERYSRGLYEDAMTALSMGAGYFHSTWKTKESKIDLFLLGKNLQLRLSLHYECVELIEEYERVSEEYERMSNQKALEDL